MWFSNQGAVYIYAFAEGPPHCNQSLSQGYALTCKLWGSICFQAYLHECTQDIGVRVQFLEEAKGFRASVPGPTIRPIYMLLLFLGANSREKSEIAEREREREPSILLYSVF
jgi:hypothetical protein